MCGVPSASEPMSVGAALTIATSRSTVPSFVVRCWQLRLSDPVGAVVGEVGAGIVLSTARLPVGAVVGEVGAGIVLSLAWASVGAAVGEVGAGIARGGGDRQTYS